ncbi:DUF5597 domain-containing protein [soil metagenome]
MNRARILLSAACIAFGAVNAFATEVPRVVHQDGRYALMVDGAPYLVLGAQINNSSSWPAVLPKVWPALEEMHVNTAEAPVYWEQLEPKPGSFDFSTVDALVMGAREHHLQLVILWFGTWKNGNMHYVPEWVKTNPQKYPRMINAAGEPIDVLSANSNTNRDADKQAFTAMMHHLKEIDGTNHTVLMIQVENESGGIGSPRDFSPASNKEFDGQVPADLLKAMGKPRGSWREVFGGKADETFQAYYQSRYVNEIAAAGKREFDIPMYCNVWVSYPVAELPERQIPNPGIGYPSGGPVQDMVSLWKAFAPSIDIIGPDIYSDDIGFYRQVLAAYRRPDNALWIPETGNGDSYAPFFFLALGQGAIGFSPFGVDHTGWTFTDNGPKAHTENFALISPMSREIAKLNYEGKLKTSVEEAGAASQELDFGPWQAAVRFGFPQQDGRRPPGTPDHHGRALVAQLGPDEFLVAGVDASVAFHVPGRLPGLRMQILRAEEGYYENGTWHMIRLWNGDQTDRGINFKHAGAAVRIRVGTF